MVRIHSGIYDLSKRISKFGELYLVNYSNAKPLGKRILRQICAYDSEDKLKYSLNTNSNWEEEIGKGEVLEHKLASLVGVKLARNTKEGFTGLAEIALDYNETNGEFKIGDECRILGNQLLEIELIKTGKILIG